jgi:hypothetical protein
MIVEMLLLVVIAVAVFAYVLAPLVRSERSATTISEDAVQPTPAADDARDTAPAESQPLRDTP